MKLDLPTFQLGNQLEKIHTSSKRGLKGLNFYLPPFTVPFKANY